MFNPTNIRQQTIVIKEVCCSYGITPNTVRLLPKGRSNFQFIIDANGKRYVLKKYAKPGDVGWNRKFRNHATISYEHAVLEYLAGRSFPSLAPLRNLSNDTITKYNGYFFSLFPYVDTTTAVSDMFVGLQATILLGKYHSLMMEYPVVEQRPFWGYKTAIAEWFHKNEIGLVRAAEICDWACLFIPTTKTQKYISANSHVLNQALSLLITEFPHEAYGRFPQVVNHGDYYQDNIGVQNNRVKIIYDFDDCVRELRVYDLACLVWHFAGENGRNINIEKLGSLFLAYRKQSELTSEEAALLPYMMIAKDVHLLLGILGIVRVYPAARLLRVAHTLMDAVKWQVKNRLELVKQIERM